MLNGTRQRLLVYHVVMASRKPKDKVKSNVGSNEQMLDGGSDDSKRSGGFDPLLGYGAVGGTGLVAGYIAGKQSGVGARIVNKVKGQTQKLVNARNQNTSYLFHGSGSERLPTIKPQPAYLKNEGLPNRTYLTSNIRNAEFVAELSAKNKQAYVGTPKDLRGSLYVVASKTKNIKPVIGSPYQKESAMGDVNTFITNRNARVVAEIKTLPFPQEIENLESLVQKAINVDRKRNLLSRGNRVIKK